MDIKVLENKKNKLVVEVRQETYTLLNLLREKAWKAGAKQAAYMQKHPYLAQPKILVSANDPKKVLKGAAQLVVDDAKDFDREFSRALKK